MLLPVYYYINLSTKEVKKYDISEEIFKKFFGGKTLGAKLLTDLTPPGLDVFSPEAHLILNTTPMTGTGAPCSSRFNLTFKNVLTGGIGSSNCGGPFGFMMKKAGIDGLIITGKADVPTTIKIVDGEITFESAEHLWGLDTEETQEELPKKFAKLVIGPAGENLVRFASAASDERMAGRCGVGAVMGSKNLKALITFGTKEIPVLRKAEFDQYMTKWIKYLQDHPTTGGALASYGSAGLLGKANATNTLPTRNFQQGNFEHADEITGEALAEKVLVRNGSCISCPIRCERRVKVHNKEVKGPEYETVSFFGSNIGLADLEFVNEANYVADILGLDTISLGSVLAFAMELKEKGMADFDLEFGKKENILEIIEKIAKREGKFYDLGEGTKRLSEKYGGKEFAIHSKGLELAAYEPRGSVGMGLGYATSNRGGCHLNGGYFALIESIGVLNMDRHTTKGKPELTVLLQNVIEATSATGFCLFSTQRLVPSLLFKTGPSSKFNKNISAITLQSRCIVKRIVKTSGSVFAFKSMVVCPQCIGIELATGLKMNTSDYVKLGERGYNIERLYNLREGLTKADDSLPDRLTKVLQEKDNPKSIVNLEKMLPVYYECRNWDENGVPTAKIRERLGI